MYDFLSSFYINLRNQWSRKVIDWASILFLFACFHDEKYLRSLICLFSSFLVGALLNMLVLGHFWNLNLILFLSLFLGFNQNETCRSYKIVLIKRSFWLLSKIQAGVTLHNSTLVVVTFQEGRFCIFFLWRVNKQF